MFGSFPKFHKRNISMEIILRLGCNFCRRSLVSWYIQKSLGDGPEMDLLGFRHTFGSHLAMKGESLYKTSTLMGNSSQICQKHYTALIPEAMTNSVEFVHKENKNQKIA